MNTKHKKNYPLRDLERKHGPLSLGRFISAWRLTEELSQKEFAKQLGISAANLCDIEKGRKGVSVEKAVEIAEATGYPATILVQLSLQDQLRASGLSYSVEVKKEVA